MAIKFNIFVFNPNKPFDFFLREGSVMNSAISGSLYCPDFPISAQRHSNIFMSLHLRAKALFKTAILLYKKVKTQKISFQSRSLSQYYEDMKKFTFAMLIS